MCGDEKLLSQFAIVTIEKLNEIQIVIRSPVHRDVDRAGASLQGKHDKDPPPPKRHCDGSHSVSHDSTTSETRTKIQHGSPIVSVAVVPPIHT